MLLVLTSLKVIDVNYGYYREKANGRKHCGSLDSIDSLESGIGHAPKGSERSIYDKVKEGLYRIRSTTQEHTETASSHRHPEAKGAAKEGIIAVASAAIGGGLAEATRGIAWDPNPKMTGSHTINYGWPFPVERVVHSINQSGSYTNHFYFPQGLLANGAIYGVAAFAGLNAAVFGVPYGMHKLQEWNTNRKIRNLHRETNKS